jgi:hypothetical protein
MFRLPAWLLLALAMGSLIVLLSTWHAPQRQQDTADLLRGTWLREYSEPGFQVRRVLSLGSDGAFRESVRVVETAGTVTQYEHEGTWLFDGTNLKRKYTLMNGKPPSRLNVPFATFEISFDSRNEFTGVDHVHGHRVHYRRIAPEAAHTPPG